MFEIQCPAGSPPVHAHTCTGGGGTGSHHPWSHDRRFPFECFDEHGRCAVYHPCPDHDGLPNHERMN